MILTKVLKHSREYCKGTYSEYSCGYGDEYQVLISYLPNSIQGGCGPAAGPLVGAVGPLVGAVGAAGPLVGAVGPLVGAVGPLVGAVGPLVGAAGGAEVTVADVVATTAGDADDDDDDGGSPLPPTAAGGGGKGGGSIPAGTCHSRHIKKQHCSMVQNDMLSPVRSYMH